MIVDNLTVSDCLTQKIGITSDILIKKKLVENSIFVGSFPDFFIYRPKMTSFTLPPSIFSLYYIFPPSMINCSKFFFPKALLTRF